MICRGHPRVASECICGQPVQGESRLEDGENCPDRSGHERKGAASER